MYAIIPQHIPQGKRAEIYEKILFCINSGKHTISPESIYNCYTGIGGLHSLRRSDFASYNEYAEAKREFEMGQFFTPHEICRDMVEMLSPQTSEMILDMCCGMGNFFNHLPNQHNAHGFDIAPRLLQWQGICIHWLTYSSTTYNSLRHKAEELKARIAGARAMKAGLKLQLMQETNSISREELERFEYTLSKYMYELKTHRQLNRHI